MARVKVDNSDTLASSNTKLPPTLQSWCIVVDMTNNWTCTIQFLSETERLHLNQDNCPPSLTASDIVHMKLYPLHYIVHMKLYPLHYIVHIK